MSAECRKCGHDLPYDGECEWCALRALVSEIDQSLAYANLVRAEQSARIADLEAALREMLGGISTGPGQQVYITGPHFYFTVESARAALFGEEATA